MRELANKLIDELQTITKCIETIEYVYLPNYTKDMKEVVKQVANDNIDTLRESLINFYTTKFTEEELINVLTFLKSEAGKKFLTIIIAQDKNLVKVATDWINDVLDEADNNIEQAYLKRKVEKGISWRDYVPPLDIKI